MRIQVDDPKHARFRVGELSDDRVINNSGTTFKRANNIVSKIKKYDNMITATIIDEEFQQKHEYLISTEHLSVTLEVEGHEVLTVNPELTAAEAQKLPAIGLFAESTEKLAEIEQN